MAEANNAEILVALDTSSVQEWKGLHSKRFEIGRKHFAVSDTVFNQEGPLSPKGRRHYDPKYDVPISYKSKLKIFPQKYVHFKETDDDRIAGAKKFPHIPPRPRYRAEKLYLPSDRKHKEGSKPWKSLSLVSKHFGGTTKPANTEQPRHYDTAHIGKGSLIPWVEKEKQDILNEDIKGVRELARWEGSTLREAKPERFAQEGGPQDGPKAMPGNGKRK